MSTSLTTVSNTFLTNLALRSIWEAAGKDPGTGEPVDITLLRPNICHFDQTYIREVPYNLGYNPARYKIDELEDIHHGIALGTSTVHEHSSSRARARLSLSEWNSASDGSGP